MSLSSTIFYLLKRIHGIALCILFFNPQYRAERSRGYSGQVPFLQDSFGYNPTRDLDCLYFPHSIHRLREELLKISIVVKNSALTRVP